MYNVRVHLAGEVLDALAQLFGHLRQAGVLLQPFEQLRDGLRGLCLTFADGNGQGLTVLYIGFHLGYLRQEDQRRGIGCLQAEGQIQKDEGGEVELGNPCLRSPRAHWRAC